MGRTKLQMKAFALWLMAMVCFHLNTMGQNSITNIPEGWKVNGKEVINGKASGIADGSQVVLMPTGEDQGRIKTIKVETLSPWHGMSKDLSQASSENIGWVIATDGKIYPHVKAALAEKTSPVAAITYLGSGSDCKHGLAIALQDVSNSKFTWKDAPLAVKNWASAYPVKEGSWRLPTVNDLNSINEKPNRLLDAIAQSGAEPIQRDFYWTANEQRLEVKEAKATKVTGGYFYIINNLIQYGNKSHQFRVRAVLAF